MRHALALCAATAALVAGCGGGSELSADDYRTRLDAACKALRDQNLALPQKIRDDELTLTQASELGQRYGDAFEATVRDLDPPGDLRDAHERLLDVGGEPPRADDAVALRAWVVRVADVYRDLGARGCERWQRETAQRLPRA